MLDGCKDISDCYLKEKPKIALPFEQDQTCPSLCLLGQSIHIFILSPTIEIIPHGVVFKADCSGTEEICCLSFDAGFICAPCRKEKHSRDRESRGGRGRGKQGQKCPPSVDHFWQMRMCCTSLFIQMPGMWDSKLQL